MDANILHGAEELTAGRPLPTNGVPGMTASAREPYFKGIERAASTKVTSPYLVVRLDGKGFSKWTRKLRKDGPFNPTFTEAMVKATVAICESDAPVLHAYTQSDEVTFVLQPQWFDGKVQKVLTVLSSMMTAHFNRFMAEGTGDFTLTLAYFDGRVLPLETVGEVNEHLWWRMRDASKNSISMLAHHTFGHSRIMGVSTAEKLAMLDGAWEKAPEAARFGTQVKLVKREAEVTVPARKNRPEEKVTVLRRFWETSTPERFVFEDPRDE